MNRFLKKDFRVMLVGLLLLASCQAYSDSEDKTIEMEDLYKDLPFSMPAIERPVFPDYQVNICDFGAKSNGVTLNTEAINNAIKAVHDKGGGKVVIPEGLWLTGPIVLQSNVNLHAEKNALIVFSRDNCRAPSEWTNNKFKRILAAKALIFSCSRQFTGKATVISFHPHSANFIAMFNEETVIFPLRSL